MVSFEYDTLFNNDRYNLFSIPFLYEKAEKLRNLNKLYCAEKKNKPVLYHWRLKKQS